jgi:D-methionine transport system substrate-binding protein
MRNHKPLLSALFLGSLLLFSGCSEGKKEEASKSPEVQSKPLKLVVGATPEPHATILAQVVAPLKEKGITLEVKEFTDYVTPNMSLEDGSLDANFFQHAPYLDQFNKEKGTHLLSIGNVHLEPMGVYSSKITKLEELKEGDSVAIPNDPTNGSRALRILEKEGLIKLASKPLLSALDVVENPKKLQFKELDAPQLTRTLGEVAIAVINTNYALMANLNPLKNALALESKDSPYANILVVKSGKENDERIKALVQALQSESIKSFILEKYQGAILPAF